MLIAEAKLGAHNLTGILQDIDRIVRLLTMYSDLELLENYSIYGAVVFHVMEEGNDSGAQSLKVKNLLASIDAHLLVLRLTRSWLNGKVMMLTKGAKIQPTIGYREIYDDGNYEDVFAKESFTFAPGLVLIGNACDVTTVC